MKISGARAVVEVLREQSIGTVFGYPGANILEIYRALARSDIRHVLAASEAGAAHAADGYARAGGGVGVCFATSGPGATNLVTGVATAYMDSSPVVFITGNVPRAQVGTDSFQEVDITGITLPITKWNFLVTSADELVPALRKAFFIAREGRPGPVLVDIPRNIAAAECEYEPVLPEIPAKKRPSADELRLAAERIARAEKPIILAGGGAVGAAVELEKFRRKLGCPLVTTMMGIGTSAASLGFVGANGGARANAALNEADLVIAVGARFSDRLVKPHEDKLKILHIDVDRAEIGKNAAVDCAVEADAAEALLALEPMVAVRVWEAPSVEEKHSRSRGGVTPEGLRAVREFFPDATVTTDVGEHQIWAARMVGSRSPRGFLTPGGMGTMGFGLGAAVGAALATGRRAVLISGDGSFMMNSNELATARRAGADITILLMRNRALGMVRLRLGRGERAETELWSAPDFLRLARAYGARAVRARSDGELRARLSDAARAGGVTLIECEVGRDTHL